MKKILMFPSWWIIDSCIWVLINYCFCKGRSQWTSGSLEVCVTNETCREIFLNAAIPASLQRPSRSAPVNSSVHSAIFQRSTSSPNFIFRVCMRSISYRPSTSGGGTYNTCKSMENYCWCLYGNMPPWMAIKSKDTLSKRPGRISAGSIAFGRLVAANTIIPYKKKAF